MVSEIMKVEDKMKQNHEAMAAKQEHMEAKVDHVESKVGEMATELSEVKEGAAQPPCGGAKARVALMNCLNVQKELLYLGREKVDLS